MNFVRAIVNIKHMYRKIMNIGRSEKATSCFRYTNIPVSLHGLSQQIQMHYRDKISWMQQTSLPRAQF